MGSGAPGDSSESGLRDHSGFFSPKWTVGHPFGFGHDPWKDTAQNAEIEPSALLLVHLRSLGTCQSSSRLARIIGIWEKPQKLRVENLVGKCLTCPCSLRFGAPISTNSNSGFHQLGVSFLRGSILVGWL